MNINHTSTRSRFLSLSLLFNPAISHASFYSPPLHLSTYRHTTPMPLPPTHISGVGVFSYTYTWKQPWLPQLRRSTLPETASACILQSRKRISAANFFLYSSRRNVLTETWDLLTLLGRSAILWFCYGTKKKHALYSLKLDIYSFTCQVGKVKAGEVRRRFLQNPEAPAVQDRQCSLSLSLASLFCPLPSRYFDGVKVPSHNSPSESSCPPGTHTQPTISALTTTNTAFYPAKIYVRQKRSCEAFRRPTLRPSILRCCEVYSRVELIPSPNPRPLLFR